MGGHNLDISVCHKMQSVGGILSFVNCFIFSSLLLQRNSVVILLQLIKYKINYK